MKVRYDHSGVHLFDRRTGLNILLDEVPVPVHCRNDAPRFVSMALTNACDLRCTFCYAPKHGARLTSREVVAWARELDVGGCLGIGFGGGEPTLHPDFASLCRRVSQETQLAVSFTTHGHHLTEALVGQLFDAVHFVRVSMDGIGDTYARVRGRPFSALLEKIKLVRTIAPFGINYVVNRETIVDLDEAAKLAFGLGALEMLLLPERSVAGSHGIDDRAWDTLKAWIRRNSMYRLAISDGVSLAALPVADPYDDVNGLVSYAHVDASRRLRASSFSTLGVEIETSVAATLEKLRERMARTK